MAINQYGSEDQIVPIDEFAGISVPLQVVINGRMKQYLYLSIVRNEDDDTLRINLDKDALVEFVDLLITSSIQNAVRDLSESAGRLGLTETFEMIVDQMDDGSGKLKVVRNDG
jgi:hypothetical protein